LKLIVACDPTGGIGYKNKLPWDKIQGDLLRFKQLTTNSTVVMGRNTWESLPKKPLPNRKNIVVTSNIIDGIDTVKDINIISNEAWIIGGAKLIESVWNKIRVIHLTVTFAKYDCDTFIDLVKLNKEFSLSYTEVNSDHTYEIWNRK
jgi:dihydrofolate reductase